MLHQLAKGNPADRQTFEAQAALTRLKTRLPAPGSPVVDKGATAELTDQRFLARPVDLAHVANSGAGGNGADIGAVELTPAEGPPAPPAPPAGGGGSSAGSQTTPVAKKKCKKKKRKRSAVVAKKKKKCRRAAAT